MYRHRNTSASANAAPSGQQPGCGGAPSVCAVPVDRLRPWLLGGAVALCVARPLWPSESAAAYGDGLPAVMLWIALGVLWMLGAVGKPQFPVRAGWTDAAVLLLLACHSLAAVVAAAGAAPRPAVNMLWEWLGFALCFFAFRQFLCGRQEVRAVMAVMMATAVGLSGYGLYKKYCEVPQTRAYYYAHRDQLFPPEAPERKLLEDRLSEPYPRATFALSNSLAGFLVPWTVICAAIMLAPSLPRRTKILAALPAALLLVCLLLTRSRSALLGAVLGIVAMAIVGQAASARQRASPRSKPLRRWQAVAVAGVLVLAVLAGGVVLSDTLRRGIAGPAKSFRYRLEYWQASAAMIADHPWLGCGPGNFQDYYTRYKLPHAPEEVTDPHNFLLEIWATAGTPSAVAMLLVLWFFGRGVWPMFRRAGSTAHTPMPIPTERAGAQISGFDRRSNALPSGAIAPAIAISQQEPTAVPHIVAGMVVGFALALPLGAMSVAPPGTVPVVIGLPLAAVALASLWPWINYRSPVGPAAAGPSSTVGSPRSCEELRCGQSCLPEETRLAALSAAAMLVNLLAAGGIAYPALALGFWLLLATGLNAAWPSGVFRLGRIVAGAGLLLALGTLVACYLTAYAPVLRSRALLELAVREDAAGRADQAQQAVAEAVAADPLSSEAPRLAAELALKRWLKEGNPAALMATNNYTRQMLRLSPRSAAAWGAAGDIYRQMAEATGEGQSPQKEFLLEAVAAYQQAVECYPSSALYRAKLALALAAAGRHEEARQEAETALNLDDVQEMEEKKLPAAIRRQIEALR